MPNYHIIPITKDEDGARLDRVIRKKCPYLNQARIEKALRSKQILVNQQKFAANYRIQLGDFLQIDEHLIQKNYQANNNKKKISPEQIKLITDNIIYRDGNLIAINKPTGIAVQGGINITVSIDDIMPYVLAGDETYCEDTFNTHKLVHRLDKETSGVLLIALNNNTAKELAYAFKEHLIQKKYLAILSGRVKTDYGKITTLIDGAEAITSYRVLKRAKDFSYLEFQPLTGKKHQLRLHALELGFPILGDKKYDPNLRDAKNPRLYLHAAEITIPYQNNKLTLKVDLPEYFRAML